MRSILFHIPNELLGYPVFGLGLLLLVWVLFSLGLLLVIVRRHGRRFDWFSYLLLVVPVALVIWLVLPRISDEQGLPIRGYGLMVLLAVVAGTALAAWRAKRAGLSPEVIFSLAFWLFVPGIVGARVFYVIEYWDEQYLPIYRQHGLGPLLGAAINIAEGGLVVYGSLIGGVLGFVLFIRRYRLPVLALGDLVAPSLALGLALGRIGCFLNGCCFGHVCELPWAVTFPPGSPPHVHQAQRGQIPLHGITLKPGRPGDVVVGAVAPRSQAARAGLRPGDRLLSINSVPLDTAADTAEESLNRARWGLLTAHQPHLLIELDNDANGQPRFFHWIRPMPDDPEQAPYQLLPDGLYLDGLLLRDDARQGVVIDSVEQGTAAAARGMAPGGRLVAVQGRPVHSLIDMQRLLNEFADQPWVRVRTAENDVRQWPIAASPPRSLPVHPTQLYGSINAALLCVLLLVYDPLRRRDGELIALLLTLYPITRFLLEALRTDESAIFGTGMSISQNVSIGILIAAAGLWWYVLRRPPGKIRFEGYDTPRKPGR